jgi:ATP-binding protein involved in chromosome partitioning
MCRSTDHTILQGLPRAAPRTPAAPRAQRGLPQKRGIPNVKKIIAVSSAKGGVGKSTLAVNLALALSRHRLRVGLLDTDIFGPSVPTLLGLEKADLPDVTREGKLVPLRAWGIGSMSMGYLLGKGRGQAKEGTGKGSNDGPVAWRGLMVMKALQQLLHEVQWAGTESVPELDVLVLDMPPGTGDVQLTIGQQIVVDGAVVVSTPQDVALRDAVRGVKMFETMGIPVLGMVRNMSVFVCPKCGEETKVFAHRSEGGQGGLQNTMEAMGVSVLGEVPLDPQICYDADAGKPTVVAEEASGKKVNTPFYKAIAEKVAAKIGLLWL